MQRQLSEIERHSATAGETGQPTRADWTIEQGWEDYSAEQHATWKTLFERQSMRRMTVGRRWMSLGIVLSMTVEEHVGSKMCPQTIHARWNASGVAEAPRR